MKKAKNTTTLENKIAQLNLLLDSLKNNEIPLEEAVEIYKNAMLLYTQCVDEINCIKLEIKTIDGLPLDI